MIRVLIVEDSKTTSQYLEFILNNDPGIEVVANLNNGKQAVEFIANNEVDIVTMDIDMPVMNGLEATKRIMRTYPLPIIIVTVSQNAHNKNVSFDALASGALTVLNKPVGIGHPEEDKRIRELIFLIKAYVGVKVIKRTFKSKEYIDQKKTPEIRINSIPPPINTLSNRKYVAIGVSTGGPQALTQIFSKISSDFPFPILVVQHISKGFLESMVSWLNRKLSINVLIASDNEKLLAGHIYFAPDNHQLSVFQDRVSLQKQNKKERICPSVNHLFNSLVKVNAKNCIAMILSGMGSDGANGIKALRDAGALTIAQDKESSMVHGMPGEAIKIGGAEYTLNAEQIAIMLQGVEKNI